MGLYCGIKIDTDVQKEGWIYLVIVDCFGGIISKNRFANHPQVIEDIYHHISAFKKGYNLQVFTTVYGKDKEAIENLKRYKDIEINLLVDADIWKADFWPENIYEPYDPYKDTLCYALMGALRR